MENEERKRTVCGEEEKFCYGELEPVEVAEAAQLGRQHSFILAEVKTKDPMTLGRSPWRRWFSPHIKHFRHSHAIPRATEGERCES